MTNRAARNCLTGVRVLVVEDETLIAMLIEDVLAGCGCEVVGPMGRVARAEHAARAQDFDCAILDVNLAGEPIHPVAQVLVERAIPFVFVTGYDEAGADGRFAERPVLKKPFRPEELREALRHLVAEG